MSRRSVAFLAVIAVAALVALWWLDDRELTASGNASTSRFWPTLDKSINKITQIRLSRGDGSVVTLIQSPPAWQVAQRNYPADTGKVRKLLLDLSALTIVEEKTRDPASYAVLGVEATDNPAATGTLIELYESAAADAKPNYRLIAGKSAGSREIYGRRAYDAQSYLLRPAPVADAQAARWLDTALIDIKAERLRRIIVTTAGAAAWSIARADAQAPMQLETGPGTLDGAVLTTLLGAFAAVNFDDLRASAPSAAGAAKNSDRITIETFDGLKMDIDGLRDGDRRWLRLSVGATAKVAAAEAERLQMRVTAREFEIPSWKYDGFFQKREQIAPAPPRS